MAIHRILHSQMKELILQRAGGMSDIGKAHDHNLVHSSVSSDNQEYIKLNDGYDDNYNRDFDFSFDFNFKHLHETPANVSADKLFHKGRIKPLKVHEDSVPLLPKAEKENSSKKASYQTHLENKTSSCSGVFNLSPSRSVVIRQNLKETTATTLSSRSSSSSSNSCSWYNKWKLKTLSLFRSAFEGHARKTYETLVSGLTYTSNASSVRKSCGGWHKKDVISPHERHYRKNRAAMEEMRRKTFLPYKKTLMGCSDLDPGVREF